MTGILIGLVVFMVVVYVLKLGVMYILERRRLDWATEREQFKKDLALSAKVARWTFRQYWRW